LGRNHVQTRRKRVIFVPQPHHHSTRTRWLVNETLHNFEVTRGNHVEAPQENIELPD
jgi:hypothetical protein